jgi:preprotein translocase subunit SecE
VNRETKRMMQRQGGRRSRSANGQAVGDGASELAIDADGGLAEDQEYDGVELRPSAKGGRLGARPAAGGAGRDGRSAGGPRVSPARFLREVRNELRQVAWPTRSELVNYTTVVLTVLVVMILLIFLLNYGFGKAVLYLFQK